MLGMNKPKQNTMVAEPEPILVPAEVEVGVPDGEAERYAELASTIGWTGGCVLELRLKRFLAENGIPVYDSDRVEAYLNKKLRRVTPGSGGWSWYPLREADRTRGLSNHRDDRQGDINNRHIYNLPIPLPVLETVQKVSAAIPEVNFYVSGQGDTRDDPFLLVTGLGMHHFIIERWDEPAFRG